MKTSQVALLALRLTYTQHRSPDRAVFRSAAALAAAGITLSSFSLKQMLEKQRRLF
ncbi:uncharacterized protein LOC143920401 [Arctopsyche grandis]|uniref:uncharacterized protein LOC143920401 n=1 Tax=Arctopsyche grandis TaxID=121162 RepID=UPI00406DA224